MPNWCANEIRLEGSREALQTLWDANLSFAILVPEPSSPEQDPTYDWYAWRMAHWGIKWDIRMDAGDNEWDFEDDGIYGFFETPWCPPLEGFRELARRYGVSVTLRYWADNEFGILEIFDATENHRVGAFEDAKTLRAAMDAVGHMGRFQDGLEGELDYLSGEEEESDVQT